MNYTFFYKIFQVKERLSARLVPSWVILNVDIAIGAFSIILAYLLRFNFRIQPEYETHLIPTVFGVLIVKFFTFYFSRTHTNIVRYTSINDLIKLIVVIFLSTVILIGLDCGYYFIGDKHLFLPVSIFLIDFFISAYIMVFARMLIKTFFAELKKHLIQ